MKGISYELESRVCIRIISLLDFIATPEQSRDWTGQPSKQCKIICSFCLGDDGKDGCDIVVLTGHL